MAASSSGSYELPSADSLSSISPQKIAVVGIGNLGIRIAGELLCTRLVCIINCGRSWLALTLRLSPLQESWHCVAVRCVYTITTRSACRQSTPE